MNTESLKERLQTGRVMIVSNPTATSVIKDAFLKADAYDIAVGKGTAQYIERPEPFWPLRRGNIVTPASYVHDTPNPYYKSLVPIPPEGGKATRKALETNIYVELSLRFPMMPRAERKKLAKKGAAESIEQGRRALAENK